jgi:hypothetical protein
MRRRAKWIIVLAVLLGIGAVVAVKLIPPRQTPEQQILGILTQIQKAIEEKSLRGTMRHVSESYRDPTCESKMELTRLAISGFHEPGQFRIVLQPNWPSVTGSQATVDVRVDFTVTNGPAARHLEPFTVRTRWAKEGRHWRIIWAEGYWEASTAFEPGGSGLGGTIQ